MKVDSDTSWASAGTAAFAGAFPFAAFASPFAWAGALSAFAAAAVEVGSGAGASSPFRRLRTAKTAIAATGRVSQRRSTRKARTGVGSDTGGQRERRKRRDQGPDALAEAGADLGDRRRLAQLLAVLAEDPANGSHGQRRRQAYAGAGDASRVGRYDHALRPAWGRQRKATVGRRRYHVFLIGSVRASAFRRRSATETLGEWVHGS